MIPYNIRQGTAEDLNILDRIHTENMKGYIEKVYSWNPTLFRDRFIPQDYQVIEFKNKIIGFLKIVVSETDIYLGEIQIDSQYQNQGIGTSIIKVTIKEAKLNNKKLWLKVINGNPAEKLYRRLGFTAFEESLTHKKMKKDL